MSRRIDPDRLDLALSKAWERETARCAEDPEYYIFNYVHTKDEHDLNAPVKVFPDLEYLRTLLRQWHNPDESIVFTVKSRQLMVSWLAVAYSSWLARFHPHRYVLFRSKKEQDAFAMVCVSDSKLDAGRLSFIERHLPPWLRQDVSFSAGTCSYPNGSTVEAVPQGAAHVESRVPSLVVDDEASLQNEWGDGYAASLPCVAGGGRYLGLSTVRMPSEYSDEVRINADEKTDLIKGMWTTRSRSNVHTVWVHYSADPNKDPERDGKAWFHEITSTYIGGIDGYRWRQHMEMDFEALSGSLLIEFFSTKEHLIVVPEPSIRAQVGWRYGAGFDYGKRNKTVWGVYAIDPHGDEWILYEVAGSGADLGGVPGISRLIKSSPYFHHVSTRTYADPSLWNKNQDDGRGGYQSIADLFRSHGIILQPAPMKGQQADDLAIERLLYHYWADPDRPRLHIARTCPIHISQWRQLRWAEWAPGAQSEHGLKEKLVDRNNDSFDSWKYYECTRPLPNVIGYRKPPSNSPEGIRAAIIAGARKYRPKLRSVVG